MPDKDADNPVATVTEMRRWFDRWLRDDKTPEEPADASPVWFAVQDSSGEPASWYQSEVWPPAVMQESRWLLCDGGSLCHNETPSAQSGESTHDSDPSTGMFSIYWDGWTSNISSDSEWDQSPDDLKSLTFTSEPVQENTAIVGAPELTLKLVRSLDSADGGICAKLLDVFQTADPS